MRVGDSRAVVAVASDSQQPRPRSVRIAALLLLLLQRTAATDNSTAAASAGDDDDSSVLFGQGVVVVAAAAGGIGVLVLLLVGGVLYAQDRRVYKRVYKRSKSGRIAPEPSPTESSELSETSIAKLPRPQDPTDVQQLPAEDGQAAGAVAADQVLQAWSRGEAAAVPLHVGALGEE